MNDSEIIMLLVKNDKINPHLNKIIGLYETNVMILNQVYIGKIN